MRIVKLSDLSEEDKKRIQERQIQNLRTNRQNRIEANKKFNELIKQKGEFDTSRHTSTVGRLQKAYKNNETVKKSLDGYYKNNTTSLWKGTQNFADATGKIGENTYKGAENGILSSIQNLGRNMFNLQGRKEEENIFDKVNKQILDSRKDLSPEERTSIIDKMNNSSFSQKNLIKGIEEKNQKFQEKKNENTLKIQQNADSISNPVGKYIAGEIAPGIGQMLPGMLPGIGTTYFISSATGNYHDDAIQRGMTEDQATIYSGTMGIIEGALESLGANLTKNVGKQLLKKNIKGALVNYGLDIGENFIEESIVEPISEIAAQVYGGKDRADWSNVGQRMIESGVAGALTSAITGGASAMIGGIGSKVNQQNQYVDYNTNKKLNKDSQNWLKQAENIIQENSTPKLSPQLVQNEQNTTVQQITPTIQNNAQNGISEQISNNYISEEFKKGLEKFKSGKYNDNDNIVILNETPQWLYNKGFEYEQPIVLNMDKLSTIMKEPKGNVNGKNQHGITMDLIEQLPEAISNPLNVIKNPKYNNRYVVVTSLTDQYGDIVIVPIEMNTKGYIEGIRTDVNRASTVYGKENYDSPKSNEIDSYMERNKNNIVYDIDTYNERSSNAGPRLQLTSSNIATSSINNSIPQNKNSVKDNTITNNYMQNAENNSDSLKAPVNTSNMQVQQEKVKAPISGDVKVPKTLNPTEISNLKPSDASTTPKLPNINYEKGNKQSSFFGNVVTDAKFLNQDLRQELGQEDNIRYYKGITNQETLEKAYNSLNKDGEKATLNWISKDTKNINAEDVAKGWILLKQYQDNGDYQGAVEIAKKMRQMATEAGQTVQAYNILSRLTPEGMFYYAQSELTEAYNKMVEGKSQKWIEENRDKFELTPTETQFIMDNMKDVAKMEDGYDKKIKLAEIQSMLKNKIPPTTGQSIKAWMRISMLFNPKTQVRNVLGNAVVLPVNISGDIIASGVDKLISQKTGVRTTGNFNIKNYSKGFGQGLYESYNDFKKGINTREIEGNRFEISEGKSFKDKGIGKALNRVDNLLSFMLDAGDRGFYEATFTNSINNQLVLNNTTEVTQDMIDIATNEALQRTWQDNNAYTGAVLGLRNILNGKIDFAGIHTKGLSYGLGDIIIPFAKTPANLTKAIVDYSPIGLATTLAIDARKLKNSFENGQYTPELQHKFVQNLGKATAGSFLYVLGYALAKAGVTSGEADDDKDVKNFMKNSLGISSYSIKIGDKTFTYDWAQPVATPFAFMANLEKKRKDNPNNDIMNAIGSVINTGTDILFKQSFMDSVNNVLNGNGTFAENLMQTVLELPARAVPTFSKQIADMVDGTQRTSFEYDKPLQSAINSVVAKIPVASKTLPVARDTLGNEIKKYGGENNLFNVMFNPANVNKGQLSKAGEEIYRLYKETGETGVFPITAPYYINSDGEKITMTAEERSNYQKVPGEYSEKVIEELLNNATYKSLYDEKKAEFIKDIISDSNAKAKYDILDIESDKAKEKRELIEKINTKNYYDYKMKTKDIEGKDATRKKNEVLLKSNYSNNVKEILYQNTTGKDDKVYQILKKLDSSKNIINQYLDYLQTDLEADREDDGTEKGKAISGTKKKKVSNYINSIDSKDMSYVQKLYLAGINTTLSAPERKKIYTYIKENTSLTSKEKLEALDKLQGFTVYKNGKVDW